MIFFSKFVSKCGQPPISQSVPAGDRLIIEMPGGGGLGKAENRDLEKVQTDVRNEFISEYQAQEIYKKQLK